MIDFREDNRWCVYIHTSPSHKYYVGITSNKYPKKRWRLGNGYKGNIYFTNAINKYGWENFEHEIIAFHLTRSEACDMEKLLILKLKSNQREYGYNITAGGDSPTVSSKKINLYDLSGKYIKTFNSVNDAAIYVGCQSCSISIICKNKQSYKGFRARYYDEVNSIDDIGEYYPYNSTPIHQFDWEGNYIKTWKGCGEAGRFYNTNKNNILRACNNHNYCMNFIWRKDNDIRYINNIPTLIDDDCKNNSYNIVVYQFTKNGEFIKKYISIADAGRKTNISSSTIYLCVVKKASNAGGYIWREEKDVINNDGIYTIKNYKSQLHTKGKKVFIFTKDKVFVDKFESYAEALDSVQGKRYNIRKAIKDGILYNNYYWKSEEQVKEFNGSFFIA